MTFVAHVVEFFLIAGLVVALGLAAAFLVARSYVRRHWRLLHGHVAIRGVLATLALLAAGRERYAARATPEDLSRGHGGPGPPAHAGGGRGRRDRRGPRRVARRPRGRAAGGVPLAAHGGRRARWAAAPGAPAAAGREPGRRAAPGGRGHRRRAGRAGGGGACRERRHRAAGALAGAPGPRRGRHRLGRLVAHALGGAARTEAAARVGTPARCACQAERMPAATPPECRVGRSPAASPRAAAASLLGEGFLVGVATSGYQVEGGFNGDGEPHNNWAAWEGAGRAARSGLACDFWRHPEEALDRAAAIGCNAFRLSVEWARLEPRPGSYDAAALERYAEILSLCTARGLEPIVTLHHFTHPLWLGEEFWLRPGSPDVFARHVARVVPALAPHCRRWVTINEPNIVTLMGWIEGACPPGRRMAVSDAFCVLDNLLTAHVLAADVVTAVQPDAEVTINTSSSSIYEHDRMLLDLLQLRDAGVDASEVDRYIDERRAVHDAAFPPRHAGEAAIRRFFAAVSPYGAVREPGRGPGLGPAPRP